jgi:PAS domain S-box-containing protein/putative nucleotidyltransferase with HDIG domain
MACHTLGYSKEELLSMRVLDIDSGFDEDSSILAKHKDQLKIGVRFDSVRRRKDGSTFPVEISIKLVDIDKPYLISIVHDITEREQHDESLRRANRALQTLSAGNNALVQAEDEKGLLQSITRIISEQAGYTLAVVHYAEDDLEKTITPMAWAGFEGRHYWADQLSWADTGGSQLPVTRAIRSGITQICHDIPNDPSFNPWREIVQAHGYLANIALPLLTNGKTIGSLSIYSADTDAFEDEEIPLLEELANDLAYGIINLRTRIVQHQHAIILQQSLVQSIETIANTVEARDPYTAGHQQRVAALALAIAQEMGLPEDQIKGVHLAAIIHDLGKIHVPAEILSKPGKLTALEYELIKTHPQDGYDILKNVDFPWPIADIILQHHERLDGSGYPQGLKGDDILLEAKIIAVADVMEAISSHRPYRAARGIDAALDEIRKNRGILYDPSVVDACLIIFEENKFSWKVD